MDVEERLRISYYKEIAELNKAHHVYIVQHIETKKIYVKKILQTYNKAVYLQLYREPVDGIPQIMELYEEDDQLTVIEEYISGDTLQSMFNENVVFNEKQVEEYLFQLCDAVKSLHLSRSAIIHRDIKPSNIIITGHNKVFLIDLNAAKYYKPDEEEDTVLLGTHGYAAPEQYGFGSSSIQSDIFAIGKVLNGLLDHSELKNKRIKKGLHDIVKKCTLIKADDRYRDVTEMMYALGRVFHKDFQWNKDTFRYSRLPVGFRSNRTINKIIAVVGYTGLFVLCFSMGDIDQEGTFTNIYLLMAYRVLLYVSFLTPVYVANNYLGVLDLMPLCRSDSGVIRFLGTVIMCVISFVLAMFLMACFFTLKK